MVVVVVIIIITDVVVVVIIDVVAVVVAVETCNYPTLMFGVCRMTSKFFTRFSPSGCDWVGGARGPQVGVMKCKSCNERAVASN